MSFLTFVLKNLFRRRVRTVLTLVGVSLAVGAVVALVGVSNGLESAFLDLYDRRGVDLVVVKAGVTERLTSALDERLGEKIAQVPGVRDVAWGLMDVVSFQDLDLFAVVVQGWPDDTFMLQDLKLLEGRSLRPGDGRVVMLGKILAKNMGKKLGDQVEIIEDEPFEVIGIFESFSVYENGSMIVPLGELQKLMDRPGQVTGFNVIADDSQDRAAVERLAAEIKKLSPGLEPMMTNDFVTSSSQLNVVRSMAWLTSAIALVIGTVGMLNTMVMSVFERTQEIGILRAIGWRRGRVVSMVLAESLLMSVAGAVIGTIAATVVTRLLRELPQAAGMVAGQFDPQVAGQGFLIALVVGLVGGLYPAWRAAQLLPTEALRHD